MTAKQRESQFEQLFGLVINCALKSYWIFSENSMADDLCSYCSWDIEDRNIRKNNDSTKVPKCWFSRVYILLIIARDSIIYIMVSKNAK